MNEAIFFVALLIVGAVTVWLGLTRLWVPSITHENRAEVARGLFEHFGGDARAEVARYYPEEAQDE